MIIKRKLYSSSLSPEQRIEKLKNMSPEERGLSIGIMGLAGATPGILLKNRKLAAIGGALGAGAGLYFTSKHSRNKQIKKLEKEIEEKNKKNKEQSQLYINKWKAEKEREFREINKEYGSVLPKEYFTLFKLSIDIELPSVGDGDEYCTICCSDIFGIYEELEDSEGEYINYLVGSSVQGNWYTWDIKKKCWIDDRGKKIFNFKQRFIKDFEDNLKEVQGSGMPRSGYDTWEQSERDEVAKYLEKVIKVLKQKL